VEAAGDAAVRIQVRLLKADVQRLIKGSRADPPGLSTACSTWRRCAASACARARSTRMRRRRRCYSRLRTAGRGGHRGMPPEPLPSGLAATGARRCLLGSPPPVHAAAFWALRRPWLEIGRRLLCTPREE